VPNSSARANILDQLKTLRATIWVVPPGIDTTRFAPERLSGESARSKLGIGRDESVIGLVSLIRSAAVEAFGIAQKKLAHLRLVIVGWGKKAI